ncbi:MAG TPA: alpha/beta hydrolase [Rhizomicrobium sp.]|jgi:acetyl esterase/lipase|nr:alpha/beta hydrolase [Rhizomicrobium sp.]HEX4534013.1 alpha/beta hydrolase [Rhizomicrobium sp.]
MTVMEKIFGSDETGKPSSDMQAVLDALAALGGKPIETLSPEEARKQPTPADAAKRVLMKNGDEPTPDLGVTTHEFVIPGAAGDLPARIYRPNGTEDDKLPIIVYWHGGGWVIANIDVYDASPRALAKNANAMVISCEYRLAPEHKFPAAHDDAFAQYKWIVENAAAFGDGSKIAVVGESAGGNLAINVAIAARDNGMAAPLHMGLVYPVAGNDTNTPSYQQNANAKPLNKPMMEWFVKHVFESPDQTSDPRLNLVQANLKGLPSATIVLAEIDPLRSEGETLAHRLKDAGSDVSYKVYNGVTHEFFGMGLVVGEAKDAEADVASGLKKAFGTDSWL